MYKADKGLTIETSALETLYGGLFTLSTLKQWWLDSYALTLISAWRSANRCLQDVSYDGNNQHGNIKHIMIPFRYSISQNFTYFSRATQSYHFVLQIYSHFCVILSNFITFKASVFLTCSHDRKLYMYHKIQTTLQGKNSDHASFAFHLQPWVLWGTSLEKSNLFSLPFFFPSWINYPCVDILAHLRGLPWLKKKNFQLSE